MEKSEIIVMTIGALISFAIGRTIMHFRTKKKNAEKAQANNRAPEALRDSQPGPESKNKAKRKRQQRDARK
jgi:mannitol-specific phosphotransferase system IIBC component